MANTMRFGSLGSACCAVLLTLLVGACDSEPDLSPVELWLSCEECDNGERAAVVALGDDAVAALDVALRGPSPEQRRNISAQTLQGLALGGVGVGPDSAVAHGFDRNFVATRQQRAAIALGDIGTPRALAVLRQARNDADARQYRLDVIRVIESALAVGQHLPFQGAMSVAIPGEVGRGGRGRGYGPQNRAGWGDTVLIFANKADTAGQWDGDETVTLHGGPFPTEVLVDRMEDSVVRFIAFAEPGAYSVEVGQLGREDAKSQASPLIVMPTRPPVRVFAPGPAGRRPVDPATLPQTFRVILSSATDALTDHFEFRPSATVRIHANAEWRQSFQTASLRWLACGGGFVSVADTIHGIIVNQQDGPVSGARVQALGRSAATNAAGYFALALPTGQGSQPVDVDVTAANFRVARHQVAASRDTVRISLLASSTSEASAVRRFSLSHTVPQGDCQVLQVAIPPASGNRLVLLRLERM